MKAYLTQEQLKDVLHYDPETGIFTWLRSNGAAKAGRRAGCYPSGDYCRITINYQFYRGHRLAWLYMTGEWPKHLVDHIDCNKSNDAWLNLREATKSQNNANKGMNKNNRVGFKGVRKNGNSFEAQIRINGNQTYLGSFRTADEAHATYAAAAREHYGEFARGSL